MVSTTGRLWQLEAAPAGATLLADTPAGTVTLAVDDAVDLATDGGTLTLPDGTLVPYTSADLETDTITLAAGLPVALAEGQRVTVPDTMVHTGWVRLDGADDVTPVRVGHALAANLPTGPRGALADAEVVRLEERGGALVVADVQDRPAVNAAVEDLRVVLGEFADELDAVRDQTIVAGRLVTGTLLADTSIGVLVGEEDQVLIGTPAGGVAYYVPAPDEEGQGGLMVPVTRMGRAYAVIDAATGDQVATLDEFGVVAPVGRFGSVEIDGEPLGDHIAREGARPVARGHFTETRGPYTNFTGYAEIGWSARAGRSYVIDVDMRHRTNADSAYTEARLVPSTAPAGQTPASPQATGTPIINRVFTNPVGTNADGASMASHYNPSNTQDTEVRMGLVFRGSSPTGSEMVEARFIVWEFPYVPATGRYNLMGAPGTPTPPPSDPPRERRRVWDFAWEEVYNSNGGPAWRAMHSIIGSSARAGTTPGGSWRYQTAWKVQHAHNAMTVAGAFDQKLRVKFYVHQAYGSTVTLGLAKTGTSSPDTAPTLGRSMTVTKVSTGPVEVALPASWVTDILAGAYDTICIGNAFGSTSQPAILARNVGHSTQYPRLIGTWSEQ